MYTPDTVASTLDACRGSFIFCGGFDVMSGSIVFLSPLSI